MTSGKWKLKRAKTLSERELDLLFKAAKTDGHRSYVMVLLAYNGALSVSELVHLRVRDIDVVRRVIFIRPAKAAEAEPIEYPFEMAVLNEVLGYIYGAGLNGGEFVFPGRTRRSCTVSYIPCKGGHISKREVQGIFARLAEQAGISRKGRGIHTLKHARLSEVGEKTNNPSVVKEAGRHKSDVMGHAYVPKANGQTTLEPQGLRQLIRKIGSRL